MSPTNHTTGIYEQLKCIECVDTDSTIHSTNQCNKLTLIMLRFWKIKNLTFGRITCSASVLKNQSKDGRLAYFFFFFVISNLKSINSSKTWNKAGMATRNARTDGRSTCQYVVNDSSFSCWWIIELNWESVWLVFFFYTWVRSDEMRRVRTTKLLRCFCSIIFAFCMQRVRNDNLKKYEQRYCTGTTESTCTPSVNIIATTRLLWKTTVLI